MICGVSQPGSGCLPSSSLSGLFRGREEERRLTEEKDCQEEKNLKKEDKEEKKL